MSQKVTVSLIDDLDPTVEADETVPFGLDGVSYEIDLSSRHAEHLRAHLKDFVTNARKAGKRTTARAGAGSNGHRPPAQLTGRREQNDAIRKWAREMGYEVSGRGRIPDKYQAEFHAAKGIHKPAAMAFVG